MHCLKGAAYGLAVAAALTSPAIRAQTATTSVTMYGLIDAVARRATNVSASGASLHSLEDGMVTGSRLGFRGSEDLGNGLRGVFSIESGFDPSTGGSLQGTTTADYGQEAASPRFWGREVYVGLRSTWVGVAVGRQYTTAHQIAARFQPLGNPNNAALSVFSSHHIARQDNMMRIDGKVGAVDWQVTRTFGEQASSSSANGSWALGAGYTRDGLAFGAYVQEMENRAGTEKRRIVGVGGNHKFNPVVAVFGGYMQRSAQVSAQENKVWSAGVNVELGDLTTLSLCYFDDRQSGSAALEGSRKVGWIHANYRFSKRTDVYVEVDHNRLQGGYAKPAFMGTPGSQTGLGMGLRHRF